MYFFENRNHSMLSKVKHSIVFRIGALMSAMTAMALLSMFSSFIISEMADSDAAAINLSGSLRMQSHALLSHALLVDESHEEYEKQLDQFEHTLNSPVVLNAINKQDAEDDLYTLYHQITARWAYEIRPMFSQYHKDQKDLTSSSDRHKMLVMVDEFVDQLNQLVAFYQEDAESKIEFLRLIQIISLFGTLIFVYVAMNSIYRHVETPLKHLTEVAKKVGNGDLSPRVSVKNKDELGVLAVSFNTMSDALEDMYGDLESKVEKKTEQLKQSNDILEFLFETARHMNTGLGRSSDFDAILNKISELSGIENMDLCLSTEKSSQPYLHLVTIEDDSIRESCDGAHCDSCVGDGAFSDCAPGSYNLRFPLVQDGLNFGVLVARVSYGAALQEWQHNLIQSVADQISMALSLDNRGEQERRVSLLNERTIIARELHDSLAQSLSYLKIQVTRLQKAHDKGVNEETFQELMNEIREGLGSAYRQLRELLSTFRLQIDGNGLKGALEDSISQLRQRSDMDIELNYQIDVVPLSPNEEIHLLQVAKESLQNAVHHSKGSKVRVELVIDNKDIKLSVCDDGVGIPDDPEKLNHYGLAIMKERSRHLNGALEFARQESGGTCVSMHFSPQGLAS